MTELGDLLASDPVRERSGAATLSDLLLRLIEANPDQLDTNETAEQWVASLWKVRNPAAKLKKSLDEFLAVFESLDGPSAIALRDALEPLTK